MTTDIPPTTRGLTISGYGPPSSYTLGTFPTPSPPAEDPSVLLIRVHSAALNPGDTKLASGMLRLFASYTFPRVIGMDFSGTVVSEGSERFPAGTAVFGSLDYLAASGAFAEHILADEGRVERKPAGMGWDEAAGLGIVGITAVRALAKLRPDEARGKSVFVSAGLGGVGSVLAQLAKRELGAARVVSAVSSAKVPRVPELLGPDAVDAVVDYQTQDVVRAVGKGSVDVYFDTCGTAPKHFPIMRKGGKVVTVVALTRGAEVARIVPGGAPWIFARVMDLAAWWDRWKAGRWGVAWEPVLATIDEGGAELETVRRWVEEGKLRILVGETVRLREEEMQRVRALAEGLWKGKGTVGKVVLQIAEE